jgi:hypothetical protein
MERAADDNSKTITAFQYVRRDHTGAQTDYQVPSHSPDYEVTLPSPPS